MADAPTMVLFARTSIHSLAKLPEGTEMASGEQAGSGPA